MPLKTEHEIQTSVFSGIEKLYSDNLQTYGTSSKGVGWKDETSQQLRFEQLVKVMHPEMARQGISVNDYGCGYGAMFRYLDRMPSVKLTRYYGYDISEEMLIAAQQFVAAPRATFIHDSHVTNEADYTFVSGTFNVKLDASDASWAEHVKESLVGIAKKSMQGFSFNLLTTYVDWKQENLYYADPLMFFDFCKRHISRYVSLLHDYPLYEWTLMVRKEDSPR